MAPCSRLFLFLCCFPLLLLAQSDMKHKYYGNCPLYSHCVNFGDIYFPFSNTSNSECGLPIRGCNNSYGKAEVQLGNQTWCEIIDIDRREEPNLIIVQDNELQKHLPMNCSNFNNDITPLLLSSSMKNFQIENSIALYRCKRTLNVSLHESFFTYTKCPDYDIHYSIHPENGNLDKFFPPSSCSKIQVPFDPEYFLHPRSPNVSGLFRFMTAKLHIKINMPEKCVECYKTADICLDEGESDCRKEKEKSKSKVWKVVLIVFSADFGVGVLILVIFCYGFKFVRSWKNKSKAHKAFEAFLRSHGPLAIRRYSYSDIKKITKSFKEKLGQGGYGGVFKGKLDDGCQVAVKILSDSKGNGEEFINEVASISRTSHINIVTLLGFCFEGSKRAVVYEFMSNGSLEKFIYETNPSMSNHRLDTKILYQIAIGVARGLEYLHKGCNTRIFHFDIKPHNILLDENFCPKISDFGLAKICPKSESFVSMMGARGTIGYIAPEVFSRNFGEVSHKSDVYSYGMMVLEMVGGRKNVNVEVDYTSEIYFPHWIYKRLELNKEFAFQNIANDNDRDLTRKMVIVSLWCIQTKPVDRPTMEKVVEMLGGRVETLQIPPKPFLTSPTRSPSPSSTH